jgi:hypothetical protein
VACFCTNGDLLSQWRGYGRGGYAIGFDRGALHQLSSQGLVGFFLRDMLYTEAEQQPKVSAIVDEFIATAPPEIRGVPIRAMNPDEAIHAIMPWALPTQVIYISLCSNSSIPLSRKNVRSVRFVGDHEKLPSSGQITAHWRSTKLPSGGQEICPR